jgi:trk system potassium uptake protein TrkA
LADKKKRGRGVIVVAGLGRFGRSLALELVDEHTQVLGLDTDAAKVDDVADRLTHAAVADTTKVEVLKQLSVHECDRAVVGIGSDIESSILTSLALVDLGIPTIWAKAISNAHARILKQVGVHHVVRPEHDMGVRVAHLVRGRMIDYIEFDEDYAMVKTTAPAFLVGQTLRDAYLRQRAGVTVVAIKRPEQGFTYATADTVVQEGDTLIVSGLIQDTEQFSELT